MIQVDLPMPEACDVCPFNYDFCWCQAFGNRDDWEKYENDWNENVCDRKTRPEYCPLKEIVICKDCKHQYFMTKSGNVICGHVNHESEKHSCDWYCADGEVKDDA